MIWDDKTKSKDLTSKEKQAKKALHIVCEKGWVQDTATYICAWLKSSLFKGLSNIPMKFVPNFAQGNGKVYNEKFGCAVQKHMQLMAFGTWTTLSSDFENINFRCALLTGNPSLRKLVLAMKTCPKVLLPGTPVIPSGPVFLSIDPPTRHTDRGSFVVTYTVNNALEAEEKLKNLLSYLIHKHGDSATYWLSATTIERADHMKWDEVNDRPITAKEIDLDDLLEDDMDWVANLDAANISFGARVEVTLARPSLLRKVSNNPLLGETDSVQTFYAVNDLPTVMEGDTGYHRTAEIIDNTGAGGSEGPSASVV
jgi:hypothetical protein